MAGLIEIDPRLNQKSRLIVLIHEALHLLDWGMSEAKVLRWGRALGQLVWRDGYRRARDRTPHQRAS